MQPMMGYACSRSIAMVRFLHEKHHQECTAIEFIEAAWANRIDILDYIYSTGFTFPAEDRSAVFQFRGTSPQLLYWCKANGFDLPRTSGRFEPFPGSGKTLDEQLECLHAFGFEKFERQRGMFRPELWKHLMISLGIRPTGKDLHMAIISSSYFALQTVRYLMEEVHITLPKGIDLNRRRDKEKPVQLRLDVAEYLRQHLIIRD